jgi:fatty acid synthase
LDYSIIFSLLFTQKKTQISAHILLKRNEKFKINNGAPKDSLPRLVVWSGRTEGAVNCIFDYLVQRPLDVELIGLMHCSQNDSYWKNIYRGYAILKQEEDKNASCIKRDVIANTLTKRSIVWVFSGVGSQWLNMGKSFLAIPLIKSAIENCHSLLADKGLDLIDIITSDDPKKFDNILNTFVGIVAIQIGMVDVLKQLGIEPDYIIGHSVGEIACAYADGCFTAEQAILAAYYRGLAFNQSNIIDGSMAAVGMSADELKIIIPQDIDIACHNTHNLCTISGPAESVKTFVEELKSRQVFAREVNCSHVPLHSRYIRKAAGKFYSQLQKIIPKPKTRSPKWLSTSVPKLEWKANADSSAEYHLNNLLNRVFFDETSTMLPSNSVTIEISPHCLLQAILKVNLPNSVHIGMSHRNNQDNTNYFLTALGK